MPIPNHPLALGPSVIGTTGGSGTRVIVRVVLLGVMSTGARRSPSEDMRSMGKIAPWTNRFDTYRPTRQPPAVDEARDREFDAAVAPHIALIKEAPRPWGWKKPSRISLVPFFHSRSPATKVVHRQSPFSPRQAPRG